MIQKIRIQNFRSIQDATVELGKVNLFIGPNNSGKSNMLKGIELLGVIYSKYLLGEKYDYNLVYLALTRGGKHNSIDFEVDYINLNNALVKFYISYYSNKSYKTNFQYMINREKNDINNINTLLEINQQMRDEFLLPLTESFYQNSIFNFEPSKLQLSTHLTNDQILKNDGSNLVNFLFNLSQNNKKLFGKIESDLAYCVGDLVSISTPADAHEPGKLNLKFFDRNDNGFWAEEVSEGVLYFLALLCLVHQPDPPKLLLLEEPEKGIHPRRIREVMNFIFQLAEARDIQIILTSHSPYVVDHFADIPECIFVFDKEDGATVIRNAARDILEPLNKRNAEQNLPPVQYTDSLGEHWVSGFLGGVPL